MEGAEGAAFELLDRCPGRRICSNLVAPVPRGNFPPSPTSWHNTEFTRTTQEGGNGREKECYTSHFQPLVQQSYSQRLLVRLVEQK